MLETLKNATHVLKTSPDKVEVLSFNSRNEVMARFSYETRQEAIRAVEDLTGRKAILRPMVTEGAERAEIGEELNDESVEG